MRVWPLALLITFVTGSVVRAEPPGDPGDAFDLPLPSLPAEEPLPPPPAEDPPAAPPVVVAAEPAKSEAKPRETKPEPQKIETGPSLEVITAHPTEAPATALVAPPTGSVQKAWWDPTHRRTATAASGVTGLRRTHAALPGAEGTVRLGLGGEWFTGSDVIATGDRNTRFAGNLALTFVPPGPAKFLEFFAVYRNVSNANTLGAPPLLLTLGDTALGVKAGLPLPGAALNGALAIGLDFGVSPMVGAGDLVFESVPLRSNLLVSFDARRLWSKVPVVAHLNGGWASPTKVSPADGLVAGCVENFGAGVSNHHRLGGGVGLEVPLPYVTPFVEWQATSALLDNAANPETPIDPCLAPANGGSGFQSTVGLGARITAVPGMTFDVGGELRLTDLPRRTVWPEPPWQLFASVTYTLEPWKKPELREVVKEVERVETKVVEREVEKLVEVPAARKTGRLEGLVLDGATRAPVMDAIVTFEGGLALPVATDDAGRWSSPELPPGPVVFAVKRAGYNRMRFTSEVKVGEVTPHELPLTQEILPGRITGVVKGSDGKPVAGVSVTIPGGSVSATTDASGTWTLELLPGTHRLVFDAPGRLARAATVEVKEGGAVTLDVALAAKPTKPTVKLGEGAIVLQPALTFAAGKSALDKKALAQLDEVVDLVVRTPSLPKLRIEAHALKKGDEAKLVDLTMARANAVRDHLVSRGLAAESIEAQGFGSSQPLAPHASKKGRQLNERLDLVIVK